MADEISKPLVSGRRPPGAPVRAKLGRLVSKLEGMQVEYRLGVDGAGAGGRRAIGEWS